MVAAYPVERTFHLAVRIRHAAAGICVIFAIYFCDNTVFVFLATGTFHDISIFETYFLPRCHAEIFLGSVFHEVFALHPQFAAELDQVTSCFRIFRVVDCFQFFNLSFRIVGDNQFNRVDYCRYTGSTAVQIIPDRAFQQGDVVQGIVSGISDFIDKLMNGLR